MVSGINFNNYSVEQLKELKQAGVQGISDKDIKAAEEREANAAKESDEAQVSYEIKEDASEVNEAQQEVETAKEYGTNLKGILEKLMDKCASKNDEMAKLQQEMDKYIVTMEDLSAVAGDIQAKTKEDLNAVQAESDKKIAEAEAKQEEIETEQKVIDEEVAKGNDADEAVIEESQDKIDTLSGEVGNVANEMKALETKSAAKIKEAAALKATLLGDSMMDVKEKAEATLKDAINANEYADVTITQGTEATNINDKKAAKNAGFIKGSSVAGIALGATIGLFGGGIIGGFLGGAIGSLFGGKKGDVGMAHKMGNAAISLGEQLGGSSQNVVGGVKQVGTQYGFGFANTKGIENIVSKEYVDTSKMAEIKDFNTAKQEKGFFGAIKQMGENDKIYSEIADASKKKGQKEQEAKTEA